MTLIFFWRKDQYHLWGERWNDIYSFNNSVTCCGRSGVYTSYQSFRCHLSYGYNGLLYSKELQSDASYYTSSERGHSGFSIGIQIWRIVQLIGIFKMCFFGLAGLWQHPSSFWSVTTPCPSILYNLCTYFNSGMAGPITMIFYEVKIWTLMFVLKCDTMGYMPKCGRNSWVTFGHWKKMIFRVSRKRVFHWFINLKLFSFHKLITFDVISRPGVPH